MRRLFVQTADHLAEAVSESADLALAIDLDWTVHVAGDNCLCTGLQGAYVPYQVTGQPVGDQRRHSDHRDDEHDRQANEWAAEHVDRIQEQDGAHADQARDGNQQREPRPDTSQSLAIHLVYTLGR